MEMEIKREYRLAESSMETGEKVERVVHAGRTLAEGGSVIVRQTYVLDRRDFMRSSRRRLFLFNRQDTKLSVTYRSVALYNLS